MPVTASSEMTCSSLVKSAEIFCVMNSALELTNPAGPTRARDRAARAALRIPTAAPPIFYLT